MLKKFTDRARTIFQSAQHEAVAHGSNELHDWHILLAIAKHETLCVANGVLRNYDVTAQKIEIFFSADTPLNPSTLSPEDVVINKDFVATFQQEADLLGHHYPGAGHLLLVIARRNEAPIDDFLKSCSVSNQSLIDETYKILGH